MCVRVATASCVCLQELYLVCACTSVMLAAGCLQYLPAALLFSYTHTHTHTHTHALFSLPVSLVGEWSRCWGPIVAQCHFLVLLISSLCCRWLSLKGSMHKLTHTNWHTLGLVHTRSQSCYLLTNPSTGLLLAPQWKQRLWLSA